MVENNSFVKKNESGSAYNTGYVYLISLIVAMGGLMFGFDLAIIAGVVPFIKRQFSLTGFALGWVVAIFELGAFVGTLLTSYYTDKIGRKPALSYTALSLIITAVGATFSSSAFVLGVWRLLEGTGVGAASVLSPMYIAEVAPSKIRGKLVSMNQLTIVIGFLLATVSAYYFGDANNVESWRWMIGSAIIPALLFLGGLYFIPESPRWLLKNQSENKARRMLAKIGNTKYVKREINEINRSLVAKETNKGSYADLFKRSIFPLVMLGVGIAILQQFSGGNEITAYMQVIFQKAGISIKHGLLNGVFVGLTLFVFTFLAIWLVDKIGRRKLLLIGTLLEALFLFLLAFSFNSSIASGKLVLLFIIGYIAVYAFTLGPVTWVLLSEIYPNFIREKALSVASGALWLATFIVVLVSPYLLKLGPIINFVIFGAINVLGFIFVWVFIPETKGKSLEEIEKIFLND